MRTEAERNRLIIGHMYLVPMVASVFRGAKGIPFEELESEARVALTKAAHEWPASGHFVKFAYVSIENWLKNFIRSWSNPQDAVTAPLPDGSQPTEFYEWQTWGDRDYIYAIAEHWAGLAATPEEIIISFNAIKDAGAAMASAMIGFTRREREILTSRFFRKPTPTLESIAREHEISYARVVFLIDRMLKTIRDKIESREAATPIAMQG